MTDVPDVKRYRSIRPDPGATDRGAHLDTPEAAVDALYDVLSGPAEKEEPRDWGRLRDLLLPGGRFQIVRWPGEGGSPAEDVREWDVDGFVEDARAAYADDGFWEREIRGRTERFGSVAHRMSSYESRIGSRDSEPVGRGVNSVQLVRHGGRWWITSVVWDVESPDQPIPERYLPG